MDFRAFIDEHRRFIRRTLLNLGVPLSEIRDVEQEVFVGAERGLKDFDPSRAVDPNTAMNAWLFGICERQAANHHRTQERRSREVHLDEDILNEVPSDEPHAEEAFTQAQYGSLLDKVLAEMEPVRRAMLVGHDFERIPVRALAEALEIPLNTAWNTLRLARQEALAAWRKRGWQLGVGAPALVLAGAGSPGAPAALVPVAPAAPAPVAPWWLVSAPKLAAAAALVFLAGAVAGAGATGTQTRGLSLVSAAAASAPDIDDTAGPPEPPRAPPPLAFEAVTANNPAANNPAANTVGSAAKTASSPAAPRRDSALRRETEQVARAQAALESGDNAAAQRAAALHAREFPDGQLARERDVIAVRAWLRAGDREAARAYARRRIAARPTANLRALFEALLGPL